MPNFTVVTIKMWAYSPPNCQNWYFLVLICPKGVYPLKPFLQNLAWGRESQVPTLTPNFTIVALKMYTCSPQNLQKNVNFWYKFAPKEKFWGFTDKVKYRCTTTNLPVSNDTIIVLKITLLHSVSIITNFIIPKCDKKNRQKIHHTSLSTAGTQPTIPTILGTVIEELCAIFAPPPNFFDLISGFSTRNC